MDHPEDFLNLEYLESLHGSLSEFLESSFLSDIECIPYIPSDSSSLSKFYTDDDFDVLDFINAYESSDELLEWDLVEIIDFSC
jgi:hypothetical protein